MKKAGTRDRLEEAVENETTEKYLINSLTDMVRIPTFVPPGEHYGEIVDLLIPVFHQLGFKCDRIEVPADRYKSRQRSDELRGERVNLLAVKDYGAKESIDINTHLDVVPAGEGWTVPQSPFEPVIKDGRVYGRGVADSKGTVASLLTALHIINANSLETRYNLRIALTTDEEIGFNSGLCHLADEGLLKGDYLLSMDANSDGICVATNGTLTWKMVVHGRSCHSSIPFMGVNAIEDALIVIQELNELKRDIERRESKVACSPEITKIAGQKLIKPVFNVTMINGGVKVNLIPPSCTICGDRRYIPEEEIEVVKKEFEEAVASIKARHEIELDLYQRPGFPPMLTDPDDEWVIHVKNAASDAYSISKPIIGIQGAIDVAYVVKRTNQPVCAFGVGSPVDSNVHGPDENVRISDLKNYVKFLIYLLLK